MKKKPQPVFVEWRDSCSFGRQCWRSLEDTQEELKPSKIQSVGFLIADEKDRIVLTGHISDGDDESGGFVIPRGCITKLTKLGGRKRR